MRALSWRMGRGSIWESSFVRSLAGQGGTSADPMVLRSVGQFVPLTRPEPQVIGPRSDDRPDRLLEWTRTGQLTYGEAESLLALDESTSWHRA
jgi:hypothetical protein